MCTTRCYMPRASEAYPEDKCLGARGGAASGVAASGAQRRTDHRNWLRQNFPRAVYLRCWPVSHTVQHAADPEISLLWFWRISQDHDATTQSRVTQLGSLPNPSSGFIHITFSASMCWFGQASKSVRGLKGTFSSATLPTRMKSEFSLPWQLLANTHSCARVCSDFSDCSMRVTQVCSEACEEVVPT